MFSAFRMGQVAGGLSDITKQITENMESLLGITLNIHFTRAFDNRINHVTIG